MFGGPGSIQTWGPRTRRYAFSSFGPPKDHTTYCIYIEYQYGSENGIVSLLEKFGIANYELVELDNFEQAFGFLHDKKADAGVVNRIFGNLFQNRTVKKTVAHRCPV